MGSKSTEKHWPTSLIDNSIENIYPHNSYAYIWLKKNQVMYLIIWQQYLTINQQREIISKNNNENSLIQAVNLSEELKNNNKKKKTVRAKSAKNMKNLSIHSFWDHWNLLSEQTQNNFEQLYSKINMNTVQTYGIHNWQVPKPARLANNRERADG